MAKIYTYTDRCDEQDDLNVLADLKTTLKLILASLEEFEDEYLYLETIALDKDLLEEYIAFKDKIQGLYAGDELDPTTYTNFSHESSDPDDPWYVNFKLNLKNGFSCVLCWEGPSDEEHIISFNEFSKVLKFDEKDLRFWEVPID